MSDGKYQFGTSQQNGMQMLMMAGFGALALFQGMQVYRMQRQIQRQNEIIQDTQQSEDESAEEVKEVKLKKSGRQRP